MNENETKVDETKTPIAKVLSELSHNLDVIDKTISEHEEKIKPVLTGATPQAREEADSESTDGNSGLKNQISSFVNRLERIRRKVKDITERVEL